MADEAPARDVGGRAVIAIAVFLSLQVLAAKAVELTGSLTGPGSTGRLLLATALGQITFLAFVTVLPPLLPWGNPPRLLPRVGLRYALFLVPWGIVFMVLYPLLLEQMGSDFAPQQLVQYLAGGEASPGGIVLLFVVAAVLAPMVEELVFRGYLQHAIERIFGTWPAIVLAAAAFGVMHVQPGPGGQVQWGFVLPIGVLGIFFGWLRVRYRALWASMIAHSMHNTLTITVTLLVPEFTDMVYHR